MAAKFPADVPEKNTNCGICFETLREPKLLACLHSFCRECIQTYIQSQDGQDSFPCPLCRETITMPDNMADGLEDNVFALAEQEKYRSDQIDSLSCDLCEEHETASKCIECKQHYCAHCTKMHSRQTCAKQHHLVFLDKDQKEGRRVQSKVFCKKHPSQELGCFCVECQEVICFKCNMIAHKHHHSKDIEDIAAEKRRELLSLIEDDIEGKVVPEEQSYLEILQSEAQQLEAVKGEQRTLIEDHVQKIRNCLDNKSTALIATMEKSLNTRLECLQREIKSVETALQVNEKARCSARQMLEAAGNCEWLQRFADVKARLSQQLQNKRRLSPESIDFAILLGQAEPAATIEALVGTFTMKLKEPMKVEFLQTLDVEEGLREAVCPGTDGCVWAGGKNHVVLYSRDGSVRETVEMGEKVFDIARDQHGQIFVSCQTSVKTINKDRQPETCFTLPQQPSGITCTVDGDVVVCFQFAEEITQYSREGKVVKQFSMVREDGHMVEPYRAVFNVNQDLVVSDTDSDDVTVFDVSGKVRAVIKERDSSEFYPRGLACSDQGHIYVAEYMCDRVMMYSMEGHLLQTLVPSENNGLSAPFGLALDAAGQLWIGQDQKVFLYRISS